LQTFSKNLFTTRVKFPSQVKSQTDVVNRPCVQV